MKSLGTILPTAATLRLADEYAERAEQLNRDTARRTGIDKLEMRHEQGETRYYDGPNRYAVASRRPGVVLWFERREDGYFYAAKWNG